jgi:Calx-beta domain/RTX calcium-binding nonapeptide repeat (4 copies)
VITDNQGLGTITNDDVAPTLAVNNATVAEGNSGTSNAQFTITQSAASGFDTTVHWATAAGTASDGTDFAAASGNAIILAGTTSATVNVAVAGDTLYEGNETFTLNLTGATTVGATPEVPLVITNSQGLGTITNDDVAPTLSINNVTVTEGNSGTLNAQFTVTQSAVSSFATTVNWTTAPGTALAGSDFVAASGVATIAAGATSAIVNVAVVGDTLPELTEAFTVALSAPVNATIAVGTGTATILDTDVVLAAPTNIQWNGVTPGDGTPLFGNVANGLPGANTVIANLSSVDADTTTGFNYALLAGSSANFTVSAAGVVTRTGSAMGANSTYTLNVSSTDTTGQVRVETFTLRTGSNSVLLGANGSDTINGSANDNVMYGSGGNDTLNGLGGDDTLFGQFGNDTLNGGFGNDTLNGGVGADTINGGDGDDLIVQGSIDGRDFVDGGVGSDTFQLNGTAAAETFRIYTRVAALAAGITGLNANTEIVITRNGTNNASIVAELDNIEEITVNTLNTTANDGNGVVNSGLNGGDTISVFGDFTQTSLNYSTITINGGTGNDTVDISALTSAHRIVFTTSGGTDTVVGALRPQDVVNGSLSSTSNAAISTTETAKTAVLDPHYLEMLAPLNGSHFGYQGTSVGPILKYKQLYLQETDDGDLGHNGNHHTDRHHWFDAHDWLA